MYDINEYVDTLFCVDNEQLLKNLPDESIDLIFCDILYNTGKTFNDYEDKLGTAIEAMEWYHNRLKEMWRVLKPTGAVYLHCNYRLIHYLRVELDKVFGFEAFRNEIIWNQGDWRNFSNSRLNSGHESTLFYAKKQHKINELGLTDVWTVNPLNIIDTFGEMVDYDAQKPIKYLQRVIETSSNEGDIVADFFLGSGTTPVVAKALNRRYLGCDINSKSVQITNKRLEPEYQRLTKYILNTY